MQLVEMSAVASCEFAIYVAKIIPPGEFFNDH